MELIDAHCHLFMPPLVADVKGVLARARAADVTCIIVPAIDHDSWKAIADLTRDPNLHPVIGIHPWVADGQLDRAQLAAVLSETGAVGIGEAGLDFKVPAPSREIQIACLRAQLDVAVELDLPIVLHCRGAFEELLALLGDYAPSLRGMLHAFTRGPELAERFLALGLHLSFGGALTRPRAKRAHRSAARAPRDRLLLETDAPSIALEGIPAGRVEPCHTRQVAQALAEIRTLSIDELAEVTTENARTLFGI